MQDFVEAAKRLATQATDRATWEANRMRRVTASQHEVELAQRERAALLEQLAGVALDLERRGQLTQEPLLGLVRRLKTVDQEIAKGADHPRGSLPAGRERAGAGARAWAIAHHARIPLPDVQAASARYGGLLLRLWGALALMA
jgi:hypothetical protein